MVVSYFFAEKHRRVFCYCSQMHGGCEQNLFLLSPLPSKEMPF